MTGRRSSAVPLVLLSEEILDVEWPPLASIERANALVDLSSKLAELLDVRQQPEAAEAMRLGNTLTTPSTTFAPTLKRNSEPARHIACMMTASLRATATQAR